MGDPTLWADTILMNSLFQDTASKGCMCTYFYHLSLYTELLRGAFNFCVHVHFVIFPVIVDDVCLDTNIIICQSYILITKLVVYVIYV